MNDKSQVKSMTAERYNALVDSDNFELTASEIAEGWHFCNEFDGLLVGPGMTGELSCCTCLPKDHPAKLGDDAMELISTLQSQLTQVMSELDNKSRELVAHRERTRGNYWAWQGNNDDHLESLSSRCPVLISAKQLLEIIAQLAQAKKDLVDNQDWIDSLCEQLCKMEDALGFKADCYNTKGAWVPTIGPWLERLRDLIAAEGELGDTKEQLTQAHKERDQAVAACGSMRVALDRISARLEVEAHIGTENDFEETRQIAVDALDSTNCGVAFLDRMKEAEWLIANVHGMRSDTTREWFERATAWLTPTEPQKGESK